jgi:hypothetical protein
MIWKLLHSWFGWDYVAWRNVCDQGVARVHVDKRGVVYFYNYTSTSVFTILTRADQVLWLTCHPSKYLAPQKGDPAHAQTDTH